MQKPLVTYFLLLGITFIFYPDGIGVVYRNGLAEHVTVVFPQRDSNERPDLDKKVVTVFSSSGKVSMVNDAEFRKLFPFAHRKNPDWTILPNMGFNEWAMNSTDTPHQTK
jgi:hypothetical protein